MARLSNKDAQDILHDALRMFDENGEQFLEDHGMKIERVRDYASAEVLTRDNGLVLSLENGQDVYLTIQIKNRY